MLKRAGGAALAGAAAGLSVPDRLLGATALASPTGGSSPGASSSGSSSARKPSPYHSAPTLVPPRVIVSGNGSAPGYLFLGPGSHGATQPGPLIVDDKGHPVWFKPMTPGLWETNFTVAEYQGQPVLTWWQGKVVPPGFGEGVGVVLDSDYNQIATVQGQNGHSVDMHELILTPQGTALFTCMPARVDVDLSSVGGPRKGPVLESIIQEVDVSTGKLLFEWRSLDHIPVSESYLAYSSPYDYLHVNSVSPTPDGNFLVSGRHTWTLYKVSRRTGKVIWRLGGKHSNFKVPSDAAFSWQHDSRQVSAELISVFDNGSNGFTNTQPQSRALFLELDTNGHSVRLAREYQSPSPLRSITMGSVQALQDGHVLVGWGSIPQVSEFAPGGKQLLMVKFPGGVRSYRAFRLPWTGTPATAPAIAASTGTEGTTVWTSWNGATEVATWRIYGGSSPGTLALQGEVARSGFETTATIPAQSYVAAQALDASGTVLGTSAVISPSSS